MYKLQATMPITSTIIHFTKCQFLSQESTQKSLPEKLALTLCYISPATTAKRQCRSTSLITPMPYETMSAESNMLQCFVELN